MAVYLGHLKSEFPENTAQVMSEWAAQAGMDLSADFINEKVASLADEKKANKHKNKMKNLKKAIKQFLRSKDIPLADFEQFAAEKGLDLPEMHPNKGDRGMCAREGCQFLRHTKQGHGFCCGSCKEEAKPQGHGGKCQKVQPDYCTREGCTFLAHPDRKHGFCCGHCKNKGDGHGKNCK